LIGALAFASLTQRDFDAVYLALYGAMGACGLKEGDAHLA
jgi:hypothetical protein